MKIIAALLLAASVMACGGTSKPATNPAPADTTGTTDTTTIEGTGGTTYGGAQTTPATGTEPAAP